MSAVEVAFKNRYGNPPQCVAQAPGRVEFIGNHTDYNGGEVLGAAVDRFLWAAVSPRNDSRLNFASDGNPEGVSFPDWETALAQGWGWVQYPLGVLSLLAERGVRPPGGFDFLVSSEIPAGAGLSSSAAFELASSIAFETLAGQELDPLERVKLCRRAENEVVGVPCGILDQGVSGFGEKDRLVHIDCATETIRTVPGPAQTRLWIFESGKKHNLVESLYTERHRECRKALEIIRKRVPGLKHLAEVTEAQLRESESILPAEIFRRTRHVTEEHRRVRECVRILADGNLEGAGQLLCDSHWSSAGLFENSTEELDTLVKLLSEESLVYGARLTGGGFGGAVMALCCDTFSEADASRVADRFAGCFGKIPKFRGLAIAEGARRKL